MEMKANQSSMGGKYWPTRNRSPERTRRNSLSTFSWFGLFAIVPYFCYENIQQDKAKTHPGNKAAAVSVMHPVCLFCLVLKKSEPRAKATHLCFIGDAVPQISPLKALQLSIKIRYTAFYFSVHFLCNTV